jgi:site-specific recombinase XerD
MNFESFLTHLQTVQGCTEQTIKAYRCDLEKFDRFLRERGVDDPRQTTVKLIGAYVSHMREQTNPRFERRGLSDSSIARRLASASSFFDYLRAVEESDLPNPFGKFRFKWKDKSAPNPVEEYTLDLLLASMKSKRDEVLFRLLASTGLRISEVAQLNRDSITVESELDPTGREILVGVGSVIGKGRKFRKFYVDVDTALLCAEYVEERKDDHQPLFLSQRRTRMAVRTIQERLAHWCEELGFSHVNVHRLRHTYATRLANAGISSLHLKELLGHSSLNTTAKYYKLHDTTLARGYHSAMEYVKG